MYSGPAVNLLPFKQKILMWYNELKSNEMDLKMKEYTSRSNLILDRLLALLFNNDFFTPKRSAHTRCQFSQSKNMCKPADKFLVLWTIILLFIPTEECAYKVLTNLREDGSEEPGIPYIEQVYSLHKDNAEVVENICVLFMELAEYGTFFYLFFFFWGGGGGKEVVCYLEGGVCVMRERRRGTFHT